jgi:single-strand DNA-binding protein
MSASVTLKGRLTRDPEMRFTNGGKPLVQFTVVTAKRFKDQQTQEWQEQDTSFWDVTAFDTLAENIAESCFKGTPVVVTGAMRQEKWQNKEGENRTSWKVLADDVAVSLKGGKIEQTKPTSKDYGVTGSPVKVTFNEPPPF